MLKFHRPFIFAIAVFLMGATSATSATYYIDYESGNNAADGLAPERAWKHAPGDPKATAGPATVALEPGDTLLFKGGVVYNGSVVMEVSGTPDKPITLDANTGGTFGEGRAILDGARMIEHWKRVESAAAVKGNSRWASMFYADIDLDLESNFSHGEFVVHRKAGRNRQAPWQRIILVDGDQGLLPIAQFPKPADPFYPDLPGDFHQSPHLLDVRESEGISLLTDAKHLTAEDPDYYDGMFIGVHGGNNHVYFAVVKEYDPTTHQLTLPHFSPSLYEQTRYAFYNSVRLIESPGEWAITSTGQGRSRIYLLPNRLKDERPDNIGFPVFHTGIAVKSGASHLRIKGFLIQRYSGGSGGISVDQSDSRSRDIAVADTEIRFISGHAGIGLNFCDEILIENVYIHQCPGWTTGIFLSRVNSYIVRHAFLDKNSGSGIRHYECRDGYVQHNVVLDHFGMHSSAINVYEGCANLVLEGNYLQNTATINRNAENIFFRNNVIDGLGRSSVALGMWTSGRTSGQDLINVQFLNNTFVNLNHSTDWSAGILGQQRDTSSSPKGLVIRGNILDRIRDDLPGQIEKNIYTREVEERFMGESCHVIEDLEVLFLDPANGDFRRRPGSPAMDLGASVPPPPARPAGF